LKLHAITKYHIKTQTLNIYIITCSVRCAHRLNAVVVFIFGEAESKLSVF